KDTRTFFQNRDLSLLRALLHSRKRCSLIIWLLHVSNPPRSTVSRDFLISEPCPDHGVNKIWGRILSNHSHLPHRFEMDQRNKRESQLPCNRVIGKVAGRNRRSTFSFRFTAYPSFGRPTKAHLRVTDLPGTAETDTF